METASPIVLVIEESWIRKLIRAVLIERGHEVISVPTPSKLLARRPAGPAGVILIDPAAAWGPTSVLHAIRERFCGAPLALLAGLGGQPSAGPWNAVIHRPATVREIVERLEALAALGPRRESEAHAS